MSSHITLSIIITNYNYDQYLPRLFESLSLQTRPLSDMEIIFVDDASTDNSIHIAEKHLCSLHCAMWHILQAGGRRHPAAVRNKGFANAKGKFLFYLDADDFLAPDFFNACLSTLKQSPQADLAYTAQIQWIAPESSIESKEKTLHKVRIEDGVTRLIKLPPASPALLSWQNVVTSPAIFRRQVWEQSRGFQTNTVYEDWDFWVQAVANKFSFACVDAPLYYYRVHQNGFFDAAIPQDAKAKAQIVANSPAFFHPAVRKWSKEILHDLPIETFPRGIIPLPQDAIALWK